MRSCSCSCPTISEKKDSGTWWRLPDGSETEWAAGRFGVVAVGAQPSPLLQRMVSKLQLSDIVVFPGATREPEAFYRACDVFVLADILRRMLSCGFRGHGRGVACNYH